MQSKDVAATMKAPATARSQKCVDAKPVADSLDSVLAQLGAGLRRPFL
jgi:hypothetical protein